MAGTPGGVRRLTKGTANTQQSHPDLSWHPFLSTSLGCLPVLRYPIEVLLKSDPHTSELCLPPHLCSEASEDTSTPGQLPEMLAVTAEFLENLSESKFKSSLGHQLWSMALAVLFNISTATVLQRNGDENSISGRMK